MIYFDNSATTFPTERVRAACSAAMTDELSGNPGSLHKLGVAADSAYNECLNNTAKLLGAKPQEIVFTSCATESANTAIRGFMSRNKRAGNTVVSTRTEHKATLECLANLEKNGYNVVYLPVGSDGKPDLGALEDTLAAGDCALMCFTLVNNETGSILPNEEILKIKNRVSPSTFFYLDAVQALGKIRIDLHKLGCDMCSFSGHKIHGIKGVGVLYVREGVRIDPFILGGGQQRGMRSGTQSLVLARSFETALEEASEGVEDAYDIVASINAYLRKELAARKAIILSPDDALPYVLNVSFDGFESETMLHCLEIYDIFVSTVSACSSKAKKVSYVLLESGVPQKIAANAVRISFSRYNTMAEAEEFIRCVDEIYDKFAVRK
ncbi:MAG: cysteine desulfurase [Clostridiales bacterium]|nr:cysteine desulfurase [Clostridiales bacterium]